MKNLKVISAIILCCFNTINLFGQSTLASNTQIANTDFLGWNTLGLAQPLNIKTEQSQNINFLTNTGAGGTTPIRMMIKGSTGAVGIGQNFTGPSARLEIRENNGAFANLRLSYSNSLFTDFTSTSSGDLTIFAQNSGTGAQTNILVGDPSGGAPLSSLDVRNYSLNSSSQNALRVYANPSGTYNGQNIATYTEIGGSAGVNNPTYGLYALSQGNSYQGIGIYGGGFSGTLNAIGGYFKAGGSSASNYGAYAMVDNTLAAPNNYGLYGQATGIASAASVANYGVFGTASSTTGGTTTNYGVYGIAGGGSAAWAGWFQGQVWINGNGFVNGGIPITSDSIFKTDVKNLEDAESILTMLHPVQYYFDTIQYALMKFSNRQQFGFLAQEVEEVLPEIVFQTKYPAQYDTLGNLLQQEMDVKAINYIALIPYLVKGYQKQDSTIISLNSQLQNLQSQLDACCALGMRPAGNSSSGNVNNQSIELKNSNQTYLGQSVPNPHKGQCTIPYYLDESITKAEIVFYDELGRELNRVELIGHGNGQLTVLSSQLEDGIYNYSLIADGKVIDTKKMIKQH